jgi:hypothetical protein
LARIGVLEPATGRSRRLLLLVGALVLAGGSAFLTWWMTTLSGLPDIGDPFDVAAFAERPIPDDENGYVFYRLAADRFVDEDAEMTYDWATTGPVGKGWLERNREALELWRRGSERPKALYVPSRSMNLMTQLPVVNTVRRFARLARLEAGRLEAEGDLEGAWRCYRAIFRSSRHVGHHATAIERFVGLQMHQQDCWQMTRWSTDPRVTPAMLRRALDSAIADYAVTGPLSDTLKVEYLTFLKTYDDPDLVRKCLNDANTAGTSKDPWFARDASLFGLSKAFLREPERSRRVTRLVYANLLAVCDLTPDRRPPVVCSLPNLTGKGGTPTLLVDLYAVEGTAMALPPDKILRWYQSTLYARHLTPALINIMKAIDSERASQATLLIALANRLYEIERGKTPETVEELVGPYLKALPEGYKPIIETPDPRTKP